MKNTLSKTMTVSEFGIYLDNLAIERIMFIAENQPNAEKREIPFTNFDLFFDQISTAISPNRVLIKSGDNRICFNYVQRVEVRDCVLGPVATLYCRQRAGQEAAYVLVLQIR